MLEKGERSLASPTWGMRLETSPTWGIDRQGGDLLSGRVHGRPERSATRESRVKAHRAAASAGTIGPPCWQRGSSERREPLASPAVSGAADGTSGATAAGYGQDQAYR